MRVLYHFQQAANTAVFETRTERKVYTPSKQKPLYKTPHELSLTSLEEAIFLHSPTS
jgi:hypothetical protein